MSGQSFLHDIPRVRVLFGAGRASEAAAEAREVGERVLVIADETAAPIAEALVAELGDAAVERIQGVRQHVPHEDAEAARDLARDRSIDCLLTIGGGSTVGLGKAIALTERLPIVSLPTTYAGSEMTPVWGLTRDGKKVTGRDHVVAPRVVVYDPLLTHTLPATITAASGLNAIAHCVDALWAPGRTPLTDTMAERGIVALRDGLPRAVADGQDAAAREQALIGAWLAGATYAVAGSSLHHKLCHILGGRFDLPHAETHAVLLPWVAELLARQVPGAHATLRRALDAEDPVRALRELSARLGAPTRLAELGLDVDSARQLADDLDPGGLAAPVPLTAEALRALLERATAGD